MRCLTVDYGPRLLGLRQALCWPAGTVRRVNRQTFHLGVLPDLSCGDTVAGIRLYPQRCGSSRAHQGGDLITKETFMGSQDLASARSFLSLPRSLAPHPFKFSKEGMKSLGLGGGTGPSSLQGGSEATCCVRRALGPGLPRCVPDRIQDPKGDRRGTRRVGRYSVRLLTSGS